MGAACRAWQKRVGFQHPAETRARGPRISQRPISTAKNLYNSLLMQRFNQLFFSPFIAKAFLTFEEFLLRRRLRREIFAAEFRGLTCLMEFRRPTE